MTVLVVGASGTTGRELVDRLLCAGVSVRAMTRSHTTAARLADFEIPAAIADLDDPDTLPPALAGVDAVFTAVDTSPRLPEQEGALARAAKRAGVGHLVKLSAYGAATDSALTFARLHASAEQAIVDSGIDWTVLRANGFMQNTLAWAPGIRAGAVSLAAPDASWSCVDVHDLADVAAQVLGRPDEHFAEVYTCTGPCSQSAREQIAVLSELLQVSPTITELSLCEAQAALRRVGVSDWKAGLLTELTRFYVDGHAQAISPDITRVTGRPARSYREFAQDALEQFLL